MAGIWPLPCPECKKEIKKKFSWLKRVDSRCPYCGAQLHTKKFQASVAKMEKFLVMAKEVLLPKT